MFEISTREKSDFIMMQKCNKAYKDGKYDFTFEFLYHIYHCCHGNRYLYYALNKETGKGVFILESNKILLEEQYSTIINKILYSIKYTGDRRWLNKKIIPGSVLVEYIFRSILPRYGFSIREEQIKLSKAMLDGLLYKNTYLCEAEVGSGKTMAYLIAGVVARLCVAEAKGTKTPITIATSSIELQKTLVEREIPRLSQILMQSGVIKKPLKTILRKGKDHYFCRRRYEDYVAGLQQCHERNEAKLKKYNQMNLGETAFDLDKENQLSNAEKQKMCVLSNCTFCKNAFDCNYVQYIDMAQNDDFDFQVTNHNMLLIHKKMDAEGEHSKILRESDMYILDEAHQLASTAMQVMGYSLNALDIPQYLAQIRFLYNKAKCDTRYFKENILKILDINKMLFDYLNEYRKNGEEKVEFKLKNNLLAMIADLTKRIESVDKEIILKGDDISSRHIISALKHFENIRDYWVYLEFDSNNETSISLCCVPKQLIIHINRLLWRDKSKHYILTSGTMRDDNGFDYFKKDLGLDLISKAYVGEVRVLSPFNYRKNSRLYISENVLPPTHHKYIESLSNEIERLVVATNGHTAILFTSYRDLYNVFEQLKERLVSYPLFVMNRADKSVIEKFRNSQNGVLFASGAMWEGVSCEGDVLSSVIIPKLPFPLRSELMDQKRRRYRSTAEFIDKCAVPQMLIKLRQGAGRLIRSESDTGVISILDSRASKKGPYRSRVLFMLQQYPLINNVEDIGSFLRQIKPSSYFYR